MVTIKCPSMKAALFYSIFAVSTAQSFGLEHGQSSSSLSQVPLSSSSSAYQEQQEQQSFQYDNSSSTALTAQYYSNLLHPSDRDSDCPPCFNCLLPVFSCQQYGQCNEYDGQCKCPPGFGGSDCSDPLCGSLADGPNRYPRKDKECECDEGWTGINCNVCQNDFACEALVPGGNEEMSLFSKPFERSSSNNNKDEPKGPENGAVCYKGGLAVKQVHQMCDVTNRKILDMLPNRPPQVTFMCDVPSSNCGFQFWIDKKESFYCGLEDCSVTQDENTSQNVTKYECSKVKCSCIPGRMLCGEEGSIDIGDFLKEEIKGPGEFRCRSDGEGCSFEEPAMNQLINDVFGDSRITLNCNAGECMHYSQVPGFKAPEKPDNTPTVALSIAAALLFVVICVILFWYLGRTQRSGNGSIRLPVDDETSKLMLGHVPAELYFDDISYSVTSRTTRVLDGISGSVGSGKVMAIMGGSGAGKSTLLDILAKRDKRGSVRGDIKINGKNIPDSRYKRIIGYVDQEDMLMGTLTVYENVLNSAMLRLPRNMSVEAKKLRTLETLQELGIYGIRDMRIGDQSKRTISGGEKRRVSIACELVTSPSILFLDEPTSGLDAYNAYNVVDCLVNLAKNYQRTVVFTIHQPRSNIVSLFDQLLLLAQGKLIYSGPANKCQDYFESVGHACPQGFNIADYLIDLTMQQTDSDMASNYGPEQILTEGGDEELALTSRGSNSNSSSSSTNYQQQQQQQDQDQNQEQQQNQGTSTSVGNDIQERIDNLVATFKSSEVAKSIIVQEEDTNNNSSNNNMPQDATVQGSSNGDDSELEDGVEIRGYRRASWWTQFKILSGRAFKNLYRNPMLLVTHYAVSIVLAIICAFLFRNVTDDISGFQNRMGLFFFVLAMFGFSCLTSLEVFASERTLFMRERANGYYSPFMYFMSKVLFDILPLRIVPPFILGAIVYRIVGLVPTVEQFWKFIFVLVMFNLVASSVVFFLSIIISDVGVANLIGSLVMLFNLLFAGLLVNRDRVPHWVGSLQTISFFHAAFEGLLVNEVRYLQLIDHKFGVDIEVPSATILSLFGFQATAFWKDLIILVIYFVGFLILSFISLVMFVKERR